MSFTFAVDFDGTIADGYPDRPLALNPEAIRVLRDLRAEGHRLVLWSCRATPYNDTPILADEVQRFYSFGEVPERVLDTWRLFGEMRALLQSQGAWDLFAEIWQAPGKPFADIYIDDKSELPEWPRIYQEHHGLAKLGSAASQ